jgi:hypothetical protein
MANVILGNNVYKNVHSVSMTTESGEPITFAKYVIGTPIEVVLYADSWLGTTYSLKIENYKIGDRGVQIGMPSLSSVDAAQMIVECALTIPSSTFTSATSSAAAYTSIRISAIEAPTADITILLFGLEAI